jgi:hypothetical protein
MEHFEFVSIPIIVSVVYGLISIVKSISGNPPELKRLLPLIAALLGTVLGVILYYIMPEVLTPVSNVLAAGFVGLASGLASTGADQAVKRVLSGGTASCPPANCKDN